jgi:hypothetical protein
MTAMLAGIAAPLLHPMELRLTLAGRALEFGAAVPHFHNLVEAGRVVRIFVLELFEGVFGHGSIRHVQIYSCARRTSDIT